MYTIFLQTFGYFHENQKTVKFKLFLPPLAVFIEVTKATKLRICKFFKPKNKFMDILWN